MIQARSARQLAAFTIGCALAACNPQPDPVEDAPATDQAPLAPVEEGSSDGPSEPSTDPADIAGQIAPLVDLGPDRPEGAWIDVHGHLGGYDVWPRIEEVMESENISYFVNLSGGSPRAGMTFGLDLAADAEGRIIQAMTINWDGIDEVTFGDVVAAELELAVSQYGYGALKVSKALGLFVRDRREQLIDVDDPRLFPIWEKAGELGVPVFIHTGDPRAFWEPVTPDNERYDELAAHPSWSFADPEYPSREELLAQRNHLLELFPDTVFVGVHFGNNPEDVEQVAEWMDQYPNLYLDIAARVGEIGRHDPAVVRGIFERHSDRILFGTDIALMRYRDGELSIMLGSNGPIPPGLEDIHPFYEAHHRFFETNDADIAHPSPIQGDWTVDAIGLSDEVLDAFYYENAYRLIVAPALARRAQ